MSGNSKNTSPTFVTIKSSEIVPNIPGNRASEGGTINPAGYINVPINTQAPKFYITPNAGYHISDVKVDGKSIGAVSSYDFGQVTADHTIVASFLANIYQIAASAGSNGTIKPLGTIEAPYGTRVHSFSVIADSKYEVADVNVDGISVGPVTEWTFDPIKANHTINATFKAIHPKYILSFQGFRVTNTRASHNDTDYVEFAVKVGNNPIQTQFRAMGDVNNGSWGPMLESEPIELDDSSTPVKLGYIIANLGHQDPSQRARAILLVCCRLPS